MHVPFGRRIYMSSVFMSRILALFLLVIVIQEILSAQASNATVHSVSLRIALLDVSDSSHGRIIWKPFDGVTILLQAGNGILYAAGCGAIGGLVGLAIGVSKPSEGKEDFHVLADIAIGCAVGATLGVPWGVYNAGDSRGGSGTVLGTILGSVGAGLATLLVISGSTTVAGRGTGYAIAPFALFLGPILGYHVSAKPVYGLEVANTGVQRATAPKFGQRNGIQLSITF